MYNTGFKKLKSFDGIISFTDKVQSELGTNLPFHKFAIGCNTEDLPCGNLAPVIVERKPRKVIFAGTFIYYNGIKEMLEAKLKN